MEQPDDVLSVLADFTLPAREPDRAPFDGPSINPSDPSLAEARRLLSDLLGPTPLALDDLQRHTQLPPALLSFLLLELELAGRLERHSGNRLSLLSDLEDVDA